MGEERKKIPWLGRAFAGHLRAIHLGKDLQQLGSRATNKASLSDSTVALLGIPRLRVLVLR
jgi:hypothetical protein